MIIIPTMILFHKFLFSEEEEEDEEGEGEYDEEEEDYMNEEDEAFMNNITDEPGKDSGCTAVVALLHDKELFVANAGLYNYYPTFLI